jgi:hypothetical protein
MVKLTPFIKDLENRSFLKRKRECEKIDMVKLTPFIKDLENISFLESMVINWEWNFIGCWPDSKKIIGGKAKGKNPGIVHCERISNTGISEITFLISGGRFNNSWDSFGIVSTPSLYTNCPIIEAYYIGWTNKNLNVLEGNNYGLVAGFTNFKKNIFYPNIVSDTGKSLPKISPGDNISLLFNSNQRTLRFKHNGVLQDVFIKEVPKIDLYFAVGLFSSPVDVTIQ